MNDAVWYALIGDEEYGPMSRAQVLACLRDGTLAGNDLVWRPGFESWLPLRELQEFWHPPARRAQPPRYELLRKPDNSDAPPPLPEIEHQAATPPPLPDVGGPTTKSSSAMFWYLLQGLVVFAVVASNIHWQWTPNMYLPSVLGIGLAFLLTAGWNWLRSGYGSK